MASCESCRAPIVWVITQKNGKRMPVDEAPSPKGNLVIEYKNGGPESRAATAQDRKLARPLYTSHFSTCPDAGRWRNPRSTT